MILDDLFLAKRVPASATNLLLAFVRQRYKLRRSLVVTSSRVVQDWGNWLGDNTMATTILDRLMHRSILLDSTAGATDLRKPLRGLPSQPRIPDNRHPALGNF